MGVINVINAVLDPFFVVGIQGQCKHSTCLSARIFEQSELMTELDCLLDVNIIPTDNATMISRFMFCWNYSYNKINRLC